MSYANGPRIVTDGLILYWDVANTKSYTSGSSTIYDLSGNNNNGTVASSYITYSSDFRGVVEFNGTSNSRITIANTSFDKRSGAYTAIGAARYSGSPRQRIITSFNNWLLGHWSSGTESYYAVGTIKLTSSSPNDTNWRIYAGTGNTSTDSWNFYINGAFRIGNSGGSEGPYGIQIGGLSSENSVGQFSFLQFYNRVLTADEILQNYNALKGRFGL
jgi:hypothetical protein